MLFEEFKLNKQLLDAITALGWTTPSPIQEKAIPLVLAGQDIIGVAQTGTGKTAAYLLPTMMKLKYAQGEQPRSVIIVPTKELAIQVKDHFEQLSVNTDLRLVCIYGGVGAKAQIRQIEEGCDLIVATPGRFMDLYLQGEIPTKSITTMVLDEADKLMDMGFMPQLRRLQEVIPRKRQNLLFSATMPLIVEELSAEFLDFPVKVEIAPQGTTATNVTQVYYQTPNFRSKINLLQYLLQDEAIFTKVLVFVNSKRSADDIAKFLDRKLEGNSRVIHSNKGQNSRINAIRSFESGEVRMLVATDVSARGIDIQDVSHVINFEFPKREYENYVHRIGRTGRANKKGVAISFVNEPELWHFKKVQQQTGSETEELFIAAQVDLPPTGKEESIELARAMDWIKRQENPDYKGAFHQKKRKDSKKKDAKSFSSKRVAQARRFKK